MQMLDHCYTFLWPEKLPFSYLLFQLMDEIIQYILYIFLCRPWVSSAFVSCTLSSTMCAASSARSSSMSSSVHWQSSPLLSVLVHLVLAQQLERSHHGLVASTHFSTRVTPRTISQSLRPFRNINRLLGAHSTLIYRCLCFCSRVSFISGCLKHWECN